MPLLWYEQLNILTGDRRFGEEFFGGDRFMCSLKVVAMIPARLGSKRIPKKNLRLLQGKPLLQYAIDLALFSDQFDEVWVNSESDLIGKLAVSCGAKFHRRPEELSSDTATNQQFTAEFLENHQCDYMVMVNSTSPLLKPETINGFCDFLREERYETVFSVVDEYAECFIDERPINFSLEHKINSQELIPVRKVIWALTAWRRETFLKAVSEDQCGTYTGNIGLYPIPKDEACDLDTPEDWAIAEGMLRARQFTEEAVFWSK